MTKINRIRAQIEDLKADYKGRVEGTQQILNDWIGDRNNPSLMGIRDRAILFDEFVYYLEMLLITTFAPEEPKTEPEEPKTGDDDGMTKLEALKAMTDGKKVRDEMWPDGQYVYMNQECKILDEDGNVMPWNIGNVDDSGCWELYEEPKAEPEELKAKYPTEMTRLEAIRAMISGAKVKHKSWRRECHVFMTENGKMLTEDMYPFPINDSHTDGWVIYEEPVKQADQEDPKAEPYQGGCPYGYDLVDAKKSKTITLKTWICHLKGADGYEKLTANQV